MSKMNLTIDLKGYDGNDANTCRPNFSNHLQHIGVDISSETVKKETIAAAATVTLFTVLTADAKKFIYIETDGECDISVNSIAETSLKPLVLGDSTVNGVYLKTSDIETVDITNNGAEDINIYYVTAK